MAETIKVGPGIDSLLAPGHARKEQLKKRAEHLEQVAEEMLQNTDTATYSADPAKLEEDTEILSRYDFQNRVFEVTDAQSAYVYFWEYNEKKAISRKKSEARMWLGSATAKSWEVVDGGDKNPEAKELIQADGTRTIGDVILMRIPKENYIRIQKRIMLTSRFHEANIAGKLSDFVTANEGLVRVVSGSERGEGEGLIQRLYANAVNNPSQPLVHGQRMGR